jgi:hypothetical protein
MALDRAQQNWPTEETHNIDATPDGVYEPTGETEDDIEQARR